MLGSKQQGEEERAILNPEGKKMSCNSCPHRDCPHAKKKLGKFLKEKSEDNTHVQGIKIYNQSSMKLFWLGSPNQLFVSYLFINAVIFTVKSYT